MTPPVALTIAGSDSGGGAGIQADLRTFAALGTYGTSAVTAVTAQNTCGVGAVHQLPAAMVLAQVRAVLDDLPVAAVKTGMLGTAEVVAAVGRLAGAGALPRLVVDPVMVATSGDRLLDDDAVGAYLDLLPHVEVLTPNVAEAAVLAGTERPATVDDARAVAEVLAAAGPRAVVVTGGDLRSHEPRPRDPGDAVDVVATRTRTRIELTELRQPRIPTANTHGTGCTFSAAIAARLASGAPVPTALADAKRYVHRAVAGGARWSLGAGRGPLDHHTWEAP